MQASMSPLSPNASVPAALALTSGPVSASSLMSATSIGKRSGHLRRVDGHAGNRRLCQRRPCRSRSAAPLGPPSEPSARRAMSAEPFSVVSASSLRSVNSDPGSSSNGPANFARISRSAIWKSTSARREPRACERRVDERRLRVQHELVGRPAAAVEGERAGQRTVEAARHRATSPRAAPQSGAG